MQIFLEKCDCLKAALLLAAMATVKSKQHPQSFLLACRLVPSLRAAVILQGFDCEEREMVYYLQCISSFGL